MIISELLSYGKNVLERAGCGNASFDAVCLLEKATGLTKTQILLHSGKESGVEEELDYKKLIERRFSREPLQYIIEKWGFMGLEFHVGPGVLIPRPETEGLVEAVVKHIKGRPETVVFDLCAGTGCVGISIANACANAKVFMIEKSDQAFIYLKRNLDERQLENAFALQGDIFDGYLSFDLAVPDVVVSNPPYIKTDEMDTLQEEVLFEPVDALDGGKDGLDFYRAINNYWFTYIKEDGMLAVEGGDYQTEDILTIFSEQVKEKYCLLDGNEIERIVIVKK